MNIELHPDIETFIGEQVRAGEYRSPDEVVTEALFLLLIRLEKQRQDLAAIHQLLGDAACEPVGKRASRHSTLPAAAPLP
jgi:putative addiction module CopG family antidote